MSLPPAHTAQRRWLTAGLVALLLLTFGLYQLHERLHAQARAATVETLRSVAALKSDVIQRWLADRLTFLSQPPGGIVARNFAGLLQGNKASTQALEARLQHLHAILPELQSVWLYDRTGHPYLGSRGTQAHAGHSYAEAARQALESRQARFIDIHRFGVAPNEIALEFVIPLIATTDPDGQAIGYVLFQIDPAIHLFPMLQFWPVPSATAETTLVRREGDELVFLNTLRHRSTPPLSLRLPLSTPHLIAASGLLSESETIEGVDYRGENALGVARKVPGADWVLVAKMDDSEIYANTHRTLTWIFAAIAVLLIVLLALGRALLARQQAEARTELLVQDKARLEALTARHRVEASLAENERRLRLLGDNLPDSYVYQITRTADGKPQFLYMSSGVERIHGISAGAILQDAGQIYGQIAPQDIPGLIEAENTSLAQMANFVHDFRARGTDGEWRWIHVRSHPSLRADGQVVWDGVASDITAHKQVEQHLQEALVAAERFRLALDHVPAHVYIKDHESRYVYANQATLELFGCSAETLIGSADERFFPPDTAKSLREIDLRVLAGEETAEEVDVVHPNGARHVYWEVKAPIHLDDEEKTIWGICGISTDITANKQSQEILALQSRRAEALLRLPVLIEEVDEATFMQLGQEFAEDLTGSQIAFIHFVYEDQENIELVAWSRRTLDTYCKANYDSHYPVAQAGIWADALRRRQPVVFNDYASYPDKRGLPAGHAELKRLISLPVIEAGKVVMLAGVGNKAAEYTDLDVETVQLIAHTIWRLVQKRRTEHAMQGALITQRTLNKKLEEAHNQLLQSEKMASIGQLAAGVAHELNNPIGFVNSNLGTLNGYLEDIFAITAAYESAEDRVRGSWPELDAVHALKREKDFEFLKIDIVQLMAESRDGLARVAKIVKDLKDFSRAGEANSQWADLHQGLDSTINIVWNELKYKCKVQKEYGALPQIWCVPSQLNQVFMNLLVNAAHAIPEQGEITICTGRHGEEAFVAISDTGTGISAENLTRIFDPFFTTKPVGQGTGLGLSLSYSIVQKHGGRIEVNSEIGKGTTFTVWLPIGPPSDADIAVPGDTTAPADAVAAAESPVPPAPTFS